MTAAQGHPSQRTGNAQDFLPALGLSRFSPKTFCPLLGCPSSAPMRAFWVLRFRVKEAFAARRFEHENQHVCEGPSTQAPTIYVLEKNGHTFFFFLKKKKKRKEKKKNAKKNQRKKKKQEKKKEASQVYLLPRRLQTFFLRKFVQEIAKELRLKKDFSSTPRKEKKKKGKKHVWGVSALCCCAV